jgi:hypothetical protein
MIALRKFAILAIAALLLTGISGLSHAAGTPGPTSTTTTLPTTCVTSISLTDLVTCLINSVGDDTFSTVDLTTLVNPVTLTAPTPLHTTTFAPMAQASSNSGTSTQHYGPYTSGSPDSGTCGNDWATDTFDRHFTVFQNKDGSMAVVEQFKDGSFVTPAPVGDPARTSNGPSPGACQTSAIPQGMVNDGVNGNLHGYFVIPLPAGTIQTSYNSSCVANSPSTPCTTTGFIDSHFTPCYGGGACSATTFFDHYVAPSQSLVENEWKNASADRGGNSGDIRSANVP